MNKQTEALKMEFEAWFENQYNHKPMPNTKAGDEPHTSVYMTMFADGAWKGWQACKEALAQPAQEPAAYLKKVGGYGIIDFAHIDEDGAYPVYTHPAPSWQGLSDDEIFDLHHKWIMNSGNKDTQYYFARAIEQALKEKNNG